MSTVLLFLTLLAWPLSIASGFLTAVCLLNLSGLIEDRTRIDSSTWLSAFLFWLIVTAILAAWLVAFYGTQS